MNTEAEENTKRSPLKRYGAKVSPGLIGPVADKVAAETPVW